MTERRGRDGRRKGQAGTMKGRGRTGTVKEGEQTGIVRKGDKEAGREECWEEETYGSVM